VDLWKICYVEKSKPSPTFLTVLEEMWEGAKNWRIERDFSPPDSIVLSERENDFLPLYRGGEGKRGVGGNNLFLKTYSATLASPLKGSEHGH